MSESKSLYERLGGVYPIAAVVDAFIDRIMNDPRLAGFGVPPGEERELIAIVESTKKDIVLRR
jgi:hypothetical protein